MNRQQASLEAAITTPVPVSETFPSVPPVLPTVEPTEAPTETPEPTPVVYEILPEFEPLLDRNENCIGWLTVDDTKIDYPVVQTIDDPIEYLYLDFDGKSNQNGTLILDEFSVSGVGTAEFDYRDGVSPSTNLIIYGHTMKSGAMFGYLNKFATKSYGMEHNIIQYDSLYEHREYELISCFYSQIFYSWEDVFKFYNFHQADTQEEFDDWYDNIMDMALYDTGVTAEFGDEFITLVCCSYQVEDGRFVVVGKRIA